MAKKSKTPRPPRSVQKREQREAQRPNRSQQPSHRVPTTGGSSWFSGERFWWVAGGAGAVFAVVIVVVAVILATGSGKPVHVNFAQLPGLQDGPPPWNNGVGELQNRLGPLHLNALAQEALAFHIHQHLDVYVNGKHVTVPEQIGIYPSFITEMHIHQTDGVIHLESAKQRPYTLGQLFGEWSVRLDSTCLGRYCRNLHWWVNGKRQTGNPADLVLRPHQEIVVAVGRPPTNAPVSYKFSAGE